MPSTQVERNKKYQRGLRKKAEAGVLLYTIFSAHEEEFVPLLSEPEQKVINHVKKRLLPEMFEMKKMLEIYLNASRESGWDDPAILKVLAEMREYAAGQKSKADANATGKGENE
jgi:hypothetical protein